MKKVKLKYAFAVLILLSILVFEMPPTKASAFYETFISSCESEAWFISFINSKFIEKGKRFSDITSENDPTLLEITELKFPASGVTKIPEAVKYLKNISCVDLSYNSIADISPLYPCTAITYLNIDGNMVCDVDVSSFGALTYFSARHNLLSSMPDMSSNTSLRTLDLSGNNIETVTSLEGLTSVEQINLSANLISSADALGSFAMRSYENPCMLDISYNRLEDIGFTANISGLKVLDASHNFISQNISKIPADVVTLDISYNGLTDTTDFSGLTSLVNLNVSGNKIAHIGGIQYCVSLVTLNASSNKLSDTNGLDYLVKLEQLNLSNNLLDDMPLNTLMKNLKVLDISYNNISNIALISRYTKLMYLYASNNKITDFAAISGLNHLVFADFGYNDISTAYAELYKTTPSLKVLKLSGNSFSKDELENIFANGYSEIWLSDTELTDKIPDMSVYTDIYELYLNGCALSAKDIENIFKKTDYTALGLGGAINEDTIALLQTEKELITLDISGTENADEFLKELAKLNILILNMSSCGAAAFEETLLDGSIQKIDFSDNKLETVPDNILRKAVSNGVKIDFSGNAITNDHIYYSYLNRFGLEFDDCYLDFNYGIKLSASSDLMQCTPGDVIDIYELLSLDDIYSSKAVQLPEKSYFDVEILNGNTDYVTLDETSLTLTVNSAISILDNFTVRVSLHGTKRSDLMIELVIYTDKLPFEYSVIDDTEVMYGFEVGMTFEDVFAEFGLSEAYEFKALSAEGEELLTDSLVATGSKVQIISDGNVVLEKTVVVFGDCSGDGKINSTDFMMIKMHIFNQNTLEGIYFAAADTYENGVINSTDFMMVKLFIFNQGTIPQTRTQS